MIQRSVIESAARTIKKEVTMRKKTVADVLCMFVQIFFLLSVLIPAFGAPAQAAATEQGQSIVSGPITNVEMLKILPVLEDKISNKKLLEKSKEKIYTMNTHELRLVAALCEKISDKGQTVSSDIAFLLVTALIVLS